MGKGSLGMKTNLRIINAFLIGMITLWLSGCTDHYEHVKGECVNGTDNTAIIQVVYDSLAPANSSPNVTATYKYVEDDYDFFPISSCDEAGNEISGGLSGANFPATLYSAETKDVDYAGCRYSFAAKHSCKNGTIIATAVDIPEDDAALSSLTLSSGSLTPSFTVVKNAYKVTVPYETTTIQVTPTVRTSGATVKVNNQAVTSGSASQSIGLNVGSNTIEVVVTSSNRAKTYAYSIAVTRSQSANASLRSIGIYANHYNAVNMAPQFNRDVLNYTITLDERDGIMEVLAAAVLNGAVRIEFNGSAMNYNKLLDLYRSVATVSPGLNVYQMVVTAPDGVTTKTYTLNVIRGHVLSTDANLSGLTLSTGTLSPTFSSAVTSYTATVPNVTTSIRVTPTVSEAHATVKVNGITTTSASASSPIDLAVGQNSIPVVVTAEDGTTTKTYTVNVTRQTALSSNADLESLVPSSGELDPPFRSRNLQYEMRISRTNYVLFTPTAEDSHATIKVNGHTTLSGRESNPIPLTANGWTNVQIVVTPENQSNPNTYDIRVYWDGTIR